MEAGRVCLVQYFAAIERGCLGTRNGQGGVYDSYWGSGGPANTTPSSTKDTDTGVRGTEPRGVCGEGPQRTSIRVRGHVPPPRARGDSSPPPSCPPCGEASEGQETA